MRIPGLESEPCGNQVTVLGRDRPFSSGIVYVTPSRRERWGVGEGVDTRARD